MPEKAAQKEPGKKPVPSKKPKPQQEVVVQISLSELHPFPDHPFQVREDASMQETAESVKEYDVLVPALARPREDGGYHDVNMRWLVRAWLYPLAVVYALLCTDKDLFAAVAHGLLITHFAHVL